MLILDDSGSLIQVITGSAGTIHCQVSGVDLTETGDVFRPAPPENTVITTAATTTIGSTPGNPPDWRNVKSINIRNADASVANAITVQHTNGTTAVQLFKCTLQPGEELVRNEAGVWFVYDANGGVKMGASAASESLAGLVQLATAADMEAATSLLLAVTPGYLGRHPGVSKCWGKAPGAGTSLTVNYNITSVSDTGTGRLGVNVATDFSSANYAIIATIERGVTTLAVADVEQCAIRNASPAAGVFEIESYDHTATTLAADDPAQYYWVCYGDQA